MKTFLYLSILIQLSFSLASAQDLPGVNIETQPTLITSGLDSLNKFGTLDSLKLYNQINENIDSLAKMLKCSKDTLRQLFAVTGNGRQLLDSMKSSTSYSKIIQTYYDSIRNISGLATDSVKRIYQSKKDEINRRLSSLDSLYNNSSQFVGNLKKDIGYHGPQPNEKFNDFLPKFDDKLGSNAFQENALDKFQLPTLGTDLSSKFKIPTTFSVPKEKLSETISTIKKFRSDSSFSMKTLATRLEKETMRLKEIQYVNSGNEKISQIKTLANETKDFKKPVEAAQEHVTTIVNKTYKDHFADKQEVINSGMAKMAKYQKKYLSLADSRYLPKHRTNPEKGKPFVERLIPGLHWQFEQSLHWARINCSPYIAYKFSDRFRGSVSFVYRVSFDLQRFEFNKYDKAIGLRGFLDYKVLGSNFIHIEAESVKYDWSIKNVNKNSVPQLNDPEIRNEYRIGLFRTSAISRKFDWNFTVLCPLKQIKSLQFHDSFIRTGVEYKISRKKKKA